MTKLSLGYSPCPNDTYIFDALANQKIDTANLCFDVQLYDVEQLNKMAIEGVLQISKMSYSTYLKVMDKYSILDSGSALGNNVGPLLVCNQTIPQNALSSFLKTAKIAIPGHNTTANLLFSMAFPDAKNKEPVVFNEIEEAILKGKYDCGLVIHESRFTYQKKGLEKLIDLGAWWQKTTNTPIPLGGIFIRKDIEQKHATAVNQLIKDSLLYSHSNYPILSDYVKHHAQEMSEDVMRQHIELYVNDFSLSLGEQGRIALKMLKNKADLINWTT